MKQPKDILTFILVLATGFIFASPQRVITKDFGNIKVRIDSQYNFEEIYKVFIFGELTEILASEIGYKEQIVLNFIHYASDNTPSTYFISFDRGDRAYSHGGPYILRTFLDNEALVITQGARYYDAITTLKLTEFAIQNISKIKSDQKQIEFGEDNHKWKINSIDTLKIKKVIQSPLSKKITTLMEIEVERPKIFENKEFIYGISYYCKNGQFTLFERDYNKVNIEIATLDNIYAFYRFDNSSALVFDTLGSFYFVGLDVYDGRTKISNRNTIEDMLDYHIPYKVENIGGNKISICIPYYPYLGAEVIEERVLIYLTDKNRLIQDLDKLIENNK
ncbi:hypothetical protein [Allomuricauda sp. NBRC 101325]|uniref:hypothetical protein n=1 Tax=Allomuricauda sp. NBRC 101325 TaxID=1113758 RepID=UPI0024A5B46D|nr:hypothetical protein [Muricauda sp. NBRC 101325]GLU43613.1 hypothetical protein Musp01_12370 [Muricauda sp. NBRC 101325]